MSTATATSAGEGVVLIVGYTPPLLDALAASLPEKSVVIIDEPDVLRKRNAAATVGDSPMLRELIGWEYMRDAAADCFYHRFRVLRPIAVIPFTEYGVPFAARLAERYGVPGAGYGAARLLRDKHLQRQVTAAAGIANPQSVPVTSPAEVRKFMTGTGGPVVLKPANRAAAVGTKILHDPDEAEEGWMECEEQDEGVFVPDRPLPPRMLAEQFIEGDEFSVEMMFRAGRPEFSAVTKKFLFPGPRPVEQGHLHPADINDDLAGRLISGTVRVLDAVGMDTGFAHCEWIVSGGLPYLVECAGRMAGDGIIDMIQVVWDYDVITQFCTMMCGQPLTQKPAATAVRYMAMWASSGPAGRVAAVEGVPEAEASPGVHSVVVKKIGRPIHGLHSSWDRLTAVIAEGATPAEALANAQRAVNRVTVTIESDQEATEFDVLTEAMIGRGSIEDTRAGPSMRWPIDQTLSLLAPGRGSSPWRGEHCVPTASWPPWNDTINPGPVDTGYATPERHETVRCGFPQGRWGTPDDPARLIAWLATDEAAWITGQIINTEGGFRRSRCPPKHPDPEGIQIVAISRATSPASSPNSTALRHPAAERDSRGLVKRG